MGASGVTSEGNLTIWQSYPPTAHPVGNDNNNNNNNNKYAYAGVIE
jgi:hypothetical protein